MGKSAQTSQCAFSIGKRSLPYRGISVPIWIVARLIRQDIHSSAELEPVFRVEIDTKLSLPPLRRIEHRWKNLGPASINQNRIASTMARIQDSNLEQFCDRDGKAGDCNDCAKAL